MLIDPNISVETSVFYKFLLYARQCPSENFLHLLGGSRGVLLPDLVKVLLRWAEHRSWSLQSWHGLCKRAALLLKTWGTQVCLTRIDTVKKFITNRNLDPHM